MKINPLKSASFIIISFLCNTLISCVDYNNTGGIPLSATLDENIGKIIKIVDGDTYDLLLPDMRTIRIRMDGIDAPERGQPYYSKAKDFLGSLCFQKTVRIEKMSTDRYHRLIAKSYLEDGTELSYEMVKNGYAWHFKKYSSDQKLAELEIAARKTRSGLWADENPMAPWDKRKLR